MLSRIFRESENVELKRKQQIDTLKVFNDNVTEIQEDVEYKVEFTSRGNSMAILVTLCPEFPLEKPVLKIVPQVRHPWVNKHSEITSAPGLLNFTVHSDLGRVVQAIIREFELRPPPLASEAIAGTSTMQQIGSEVSVNGRGSPTYGLPMYPSTIPNSSGLSKLSAYTDYSVGAPSMTVRTQSAVFPELTSFTNDDLKKLNESEDRLDKFIESLSQTQKMNRTLEDLMTRNEELAKETVSKQQKFENLKQSVREKLDNVAVLKNSYEKHSQEYQKISEKYAPQNIKESLRLAAMHSDEESEKIAEHFLNCKIDLDQFVMSYIEKRMLSQSRKTKEEKLSHQLKELQKAGY